MLWWRTIETAVKYPLVLEGKYQAFMGEISLWFLIENIDGVAVVNVLRYLLIQQTITMFTQFPFLRETISR